MIKVRVCRKTPTGSLVEQGFLECHGIKVRRPDGTVRVEVDPKRRPIPEEVSLHPPGVVTPQTAVQIGFALSAGNLRGQIEGLEWFVVS